MSKYHNIKENGFDSRKERDRWFALRLMERAGIISDLRRQVSFELIPAQRIDGKVVERACRYVADFVYTQDGKTVVEDVKGGVKTKEYVIKRKLMLLRGIRIREV